MLQLHISPITTYFLLFMNVHSKNVVDATTALETLNFSARIAQRMDARLPITTSSSGEVQTCSLRDSPWSAEGHFENEQDWRYITKLVQSQITLVNKKFPEQRFRQSDYKFMIDCGMDPDHIRGWVREWRKTLNLQAFQDMHSEGNRKRLLRRWNEQGHSLEWLSKKHNISPGAIARLLCHEMLGYEWGSSFLRAADRVYRLPEARHDPLDYRVLKTLSQATQSNLKRLVLEASDDNLWSIGTFTQKDHSQSREHCAVSDVRRWIPKFRFETEKEQKTRGERHDTPDILFYEPVYVEEIGKSIRWIEIKAGWVIPEITNQASVYSFVDQVNRYSTRFGPGIVLWYHGWSPTLKSVCHSDVHHVCPRFRVITPKTLKTSK